MFFGQLSKRAPCCFSGIKVGTQFLPLRNSDGSCNANHSISYYMQPNALWYGVTGEPSCRLANKWAHAYCIHHKQARASEMHSIALFSFTPFQIALPNRQKRKVEIRRSERLYFIDVYRIIINCSGVINYFRSAFKNSFVSLALSY